MMADDGTLAQIAALKAMTTPELRHQWLQLFDTPPPPYNKKFLQSRLIYRIQELVYGGLKPATVARLEVLGEQLDKGDIAVRRRRANGRPIAAGTTLIREYQGAVHHVTVLHEGFEWQGRPYKSLSSVARAITNTRWNGLVFFGLKSRGDRI